MGHDHGINPFQTAGFDHFDFAAAAFFRGGAEQHDFAFQFFLFDEVRHRQESGDSRRADQIMSAAVPDFRQGVIFGRERKHGSVIRSVFTAERGFDPAIGDRDVISLAFQEFPGACRRVFFRVGDLRMIPDVIRQ